MEKTFVLMIVFGFIFVGGLLAEGNGKCEDSNGESTGELIKRAQSIIGDDAVKDKDEATAADSAKKVPISIEDKIEDFENQIDSLQDLLEKLRQKRSAELAANKLNAEVGEYSKEDLSYQKTADELEAAVATLERKLEAIRKQHTLSIEKIELENEEGRLKKEMKEMKRIKVKLLLSGGILPHSYERYVEANYNYSDSYYNYNDYDYNYEYDQNGRRKIVEYESFAFGEACLRIGFSKGLNPFAIGGLIGFNAKSEGYGGLLAFIPLTKSDTGSSVVYGEFGGIAYFSTGTMDRNPNKKPAFFVAGIGFETKNSVCGMGFFIHFVPGDEFPMRAAARIIF